MDEGPKGLEEGDGGLDGWRRRGLGNTGAGLKNLVFLFKKRGEGRG